MKFVMASRNLSVPENGGKYHLVSLQFSLRIVFFHRLHVVIPHSKGSPGR